jgi:hypothetical protein
MAKNYKLSNTQQNFIINPTSDLILTNTNENLSILSVNLDKYVISKINVANNNMYQIFCNNGLKDYTTYANFNNITNFGVHYIYNASDGPTTFKRYISITLGLGIQYSINQYFCQIAIPFNANNTYIYIRYNEGGTISSWQNLSFNKAKSANNFSPPSKIINISGKLGIGITPSYKLDVGLIYGGTYPFYAYYIDPRYGSGPATVQRQISAKFETAIWCFSWIAARSDMRIKKNIEDINDDLALQQILSIQPKTYNYIDIVNKGDKKVYGFIAQQIKEVIPEAVSIEHEVIPNIYKEGLCLNNVITMDDDISSIIKINDTIDIIDYNNKRDSYKVLSVENNKFTIDKNIDTEKVFIYGTKIDDFHTISKEYIFTLNVCATQELYKRIEEQNKIINQNYIIFQELKNDFDIFLKEKNIIL